MVAARRARANFALQRAVELAVELGRPLIVFEPLRVGYPWASDRLHAFVLQGMADNARAFARHAGALLPLRRSQARRGPRPARALAADAAVVVTDDSRRSSCRGMVAAAAGRSTSALEAVDGNGLHPMRAADRSTRPRTRSAAPAEDAAGATSTTSRERIRSPASACRRPRRWPRCWPAGRTHRRPCSTAPRARSRAADRSRRRAGPGPWRGRRRRSAG